jgi:hypothetical protein
MYLFHKLPIPLILLLASAAIAQDKKDDSQGPSNTYEYQGSGAETPSRDMVIIGSQNLQSDLQRSIVNNYQETRGRYVSSKNEKLVYTVTVLPRGGRGRLGASEPRITASKEIPTGAVPRMSALREGGLPVQILLNKIPSPADSEEIRQRNLNLACEDFQRKIADYQEKTEKSMQESLRNRRADLAKAEKELQELNQRKAEVESAMHRKQINSDILAYLYKEKVKLDLDALEQRAKLEAMTKYLDRIAPIQKEMEKISQEITALESRALSADISQDEKTAINKGLVQLRGKYDALRKTLDSPENAMPKEQYTDVKINLVAMEKRYEVVRKLIDEYEQAEKTAADLTKINERMGIVEAMKGDATNNIKRFEQTLKDAKDHPLRLITKEEFEAMQAKAAQQEEKSTDGDEAGK